MATRDGDDSARSKLALNELCRVYWPPLFIFLRRHGFQEADAKDLTQEFLGHFLRRDGFARVQPDKTSSCDHGDNHG